MLKRDFISLQENRLEKINWKHINWDELIKLSKSQLPKKDCTCNREEFIYWNSFDPKGNYKPLLILGKLYDERRKPPYTYDEYDRGRGLNIIAVGYYPFVNSFILQCEKCKSIFMYYWEGLAGHGPFDLMIWVQPKNIRIVYPKCGPLRRAVESLRRYLDD